MLLKENQIFSHSNYFNFKKLLRIDLIEKLKSQTDGRGEFSKGKFLTLSHLLECGILASWPCHRFFLLIPVHPTVLVCVA